MLHLFEDVPTLLLWPALAAIAVLWFWLLCGGLYLLLHRSRFADVAWRWKTQQKQTRPDQVKGEILDGTRAIAAAAGAIAIAFWCHYNGWSQLYASPTDHPLWVIPASIVGVFVVMEVFEWWFHWACHRNPLLWKIHKHHHRYANPTPFGVMADHPLDMFIKASPIIWIPFLFPIWDVARVGTFVSLNLLYGIYLHAGFDPPWMPSPHSRYLVTGWHHNEHHAGAKDYNYGFFTGFLDIAFGTRFTPSDKAAARPGYQCPECRNAHQEAPVEVAAAG